ncbi:hypothetical protein HDU97_008831 [Phlyctochytrium planicorne]|nr:hypothetical protein HDU97_008831 [Phlyctochytrium planicorne]
MSTAEISEDCRRLIAIFGSTITQKDCCDGATSGCDDSKRITMINMNGRNFGGEMPDLNGFVELQEVNLRYNGYVGDVAVRIRLLNKLRHLDIINNCFKQAFGSATQRPTSECDAFYARIDAESAKTTTTTTTFFSTILFTSTPQSSISPPTAPSAVTITVPGAPIPNNNNPSSPTTVVVIEKQDPQQVQSTVFLNRTNSGQVTSGGEGGGKEVEMGVGIGVGIFGVVLVGVLVWVFWGWKRIGRGRGVGVEVGKVGKEVIDRRVTELERQVVRQMERCVANDEEQQRVVEPLEDEDTDRRHNGVTALRSVGVLLPLSSTATTDTTLDRTVSSSSAAGSLPRHFESRRSSDVGKSSISSSAPAGTSSRLVTPSQSAPARIPPLREFIEMTPAQLSEWLESMDVTPRIAEVLKERGVSGRMLVEADERDLERWGVDREVSRNILMYVVGVVRDEGQGAGGGERNVVGPPVYS